MTFLFTDIEGSTRLERAVGSAAWAGIVARHDDLNRPAGRDLDAIRARLERARIVAGPMIRC